MEGVIGEIGITDDIELEIRVLLDFFVVLKLKVEWSRVSNGVGVQ